MKRYEIIDAINKVHTANEKWFSAQRDYLEQSGRVMQRLLHEAAIQRMSAEQIAEETPYTVSTLRTIMRLAGLNPKHSLRLLSDKAAKALKRNADLMAVDVTEIDLTSPLAYLPGGSELGRVVKTEGVAEMDLTVDEQAEEAFDEWCSSSGREYGPHRNEALLVFVAGFKAACA